MKKPSSTTIIVILFTRKSRKNYSFNNFHPPPTLFLNHLLETPALVFHSEIETKFPTHYGNDSPLSFSLNVRHSSVLRESEQQKKKASLGSPEKVARRVIKLLLASVRSQDLEGWSSFGRNSLRFMAWHYGYGRASARSVSHKAVRALRNWQ